MSEPRPDRRTSSPPTGAPPTAVELAADVRSGRRRAVDVVEGCLRAIEAANPTLGAFVVVDADGARRAAEAVDRAVAEGRDPGPLAGVPFGVKDLEDCAGLPTSHGSLLYRDGPPAVADSPNVARMRAAGGVPVGKTATPEFGAVAITETAAWGTARNPWDPTRTPGGSSGGSAAAVAGGLVPIATASDGGGSIRIPAAFTGLVGFKPSFGRVPVPGNQPSATAVVGVVATTVADVATHLDVAAGPDDRDRTSLPAAAGSWRDAAETAAVAGLRARWSTDLGFAVVDPEVAAVCEQAAADLVAAAGLRWAPGPVDLGDPVRVWSSSGVLDLWMDLGPGMWPDAAPSLMPYTRIPLERTEHVEAPRIAEIWKRRQLLDDRLAALFAEVDVLLTPTTAVPAFAAEWPMPSRINGQKVHPSMTVPFTMLANLGWQPAVSLPAGFSSDGLPIGLQVMCRRHADATVLRLARLFEHARPWPRLAPPLA
ncbi:MAG TPA: amidase family protein [Acidimicrobiales bacterium]|nr:amidase family protein [Acidimicrobiales bacterium]